MNSKWSCAVSEGNILSDGTEKGLEVKYSIGTRASEYRVGGYIKGSAIYGQDSLPL